MSVRPASSATAARRSTRSRLRARISASRWSKCSGSRRARDAGSTSSSCWYLPVSQPPFSGAHTSTPIPCRRQTGSTSDSMPRTSTLYGGCSLAGRVQPRSRGEALQLVELGRPGTSRCRRHRPCPPGPVRRTRRASPRSACPGRGGASGTGRCGRRRGGAGWRRRRPATHRRDSPRSARIVAHRVADLGGQHDAVAPAGERLADDVLGHAEVVDVGGVDEVDAGVERDVDHPTAGVAVGVAPAAEHHRAERERADLDPLCRAAALRQPARLTLEDDAVPVVDALGDEPVGRDDEPHHAANRDRRVR